MQYTIYADIAFLIRKIDRCKNNPEKYLTRKISEYIPCQYLMSTVCGFNHLENKHILYRGKDCMKKFSDSLRVHQKNIVGFRKKSYC